MKILRRLNLPTLEERRGSNRDQDLEPTDQVDPHNFYNEGRCQRKGKHKGAPSKDL